MMHVNEHYLNHYPHDQQQQGFDRRFLCPLAYRVMVDPVMLPCGHSFERCEMQRWVEDHGHCCPIDHEQFDSSSRIKPNCQLQWEILYHTRQQQEEQQSILQQKSTRKTVELMKDFDIDFHPSLKRGTLVASKASQIVETMGPLSPVRPAFLSDEASFGSMSNSRSDKSLTNCRMPQRRQSIYSAFLSDEGSPTDKKDMSKSRSDNSLTNCRMPQRRQSIRSSFLSDEGSPTGKKDMSKSRSDNSLTSCRMPQRTRSIILGRKTASSKHDDDDESQGMKNATFEAPNESSTYLREDLPTKVNNKSKLRIRNEVLTIVCG